MQNTSNSFNLLNKVNVTIDTVTNPFHFELSDLFSLGARVNPKRSFLFISKLLGKHLEVQPDIPKLAGHLLANLLTDKYETGYFSDVSLLVNAVKQEYVSTAVKNELTKTVPLSKKTLFLGFAETATGIGHAVFSAFDNAYYVHTTREEFSDKKSVFAFMEEHSHATDHLCYLLEPSIMHEVEHIILIDDEITTGNTSLNLIRALNEQYPNKHYTVLSLLDWRTDEQIDNYFQFEQELDLQIETLSLLRGTIALDSSYTFEQPILNKAATLSSDSLVTLRTPFKERVTAIGLNGQEQSLLLTTGRFGVYSETAKKIEDEAKRIGQQLKNERIGKKTLCIGNGEFMYIPSRVAAYMGNGIVYKSSTRSPIYVASNNEGYPIYDRLVFEVSPGIENYLYNLENQEYNEVFMFFEETPPHDALVELKAKFYEKGIYNVTFVVL